MKEYFEFEGFTDDLFLDKKENYSNFAIDPATAVIEAGGKTIEAFGKGAEAVGKIAETSAINLIRYMANDISSTINFIFFVRPFN